MVQHHNGRLSLFLCWFSKEHTLKVGIKFSFTIQNAKPSAEEDAYQAVCFGIKVRNM